MSNQPPPIPARIERLNPYICARHTCKGDEWTLLDANESPAPLSIALPTLPELNRYPDPTGDELRQAIADFYGVRTDEVIVGNGCDELIALSVLAFVRPFSWVLSIEPTYGMYKVCADTFGASFWTVPLAADFSLDIQKLRESFERTDVIFLCTPNNPTGTLLPQSVLEWVIEDFEGLVVIDEAYGEFADAEGTPSCIESVKRGAKNVLVLRTFSKAFGAAGLRLGYGIGNAQIIEQLLKVKLPYNVNVLTQKIGMALWENRSVMEENVRTLQKNRQYLMDRLKEMNCTVCPSVTNFFLMEPPSTVSCDALYSVLRDEYGLILRRFGGNALLENKLRISVGTREQNNRLLSAISSLL